MLIDTHAHLNFAAFDQDREEIIKQCLEKDIWMINVGTQYDTSKKAVEIAERYKKGVYAAIGLHPLNLEERKIDKLEVGSLPEPKVPAEEFDILRYKNLAQSEKVVAIGEIGLDYYYKPKTKKKLAEFKQRQKEVLLKQINLAEELCLPIIFHCRVAHDDFYKVLISNFQFPISKLKGVMHGFVGTTEQLQKYLELGLYIGFNGIIFKKIEGVNFEENIKETPLDRILIETDCPYLTPPSFEDVRNNPFSVKYTVERIAQVKNLSFKQVAEIVTQNAKTLFKLTV